LGKVQGRIREGSIAILWAHLQYSRILSSWEAQVRREKDTICYKRGNAMETRIVPAALSLFALVTLPAGAVAPVAVDVQPKTTQRKTQYWRRLTMALKTTITCILLASALLLPACAPSAGPESADAVPEPGTWRIIPTSLEVETTNEGGRSVTIDVAFENGTEEFSMKEFETDGSYLTAQGGATFPVTGFSRSGSIVEGGGATERTAIGVASVLPPGFRARGVRTVWVSYGFVTEVADNYSQLLAEVADDAHLAKLTIPDYGELDLEGEVGNPAFPGEARGISVFEVGNGVEVPARAILTVTRATREAIEHSGDFGEFDRVTVYISYKNLTNSYDDTFAVHLSLIGDDGFFYELVTGDGAGGIQRLRADAGETITFDKGYAVPPTTKGLKLIATGGVNAVFDTGL